MKRLAVYIALATAALTVSVVRMAVPSRETAQSGTNAVLPGTFFGRELHPVELTEAEERFYAGFPGIVRKYAIGNGEEVLFRYIERPTRMLHPASECYKAGGAKLTYPGPVDYAVPELSARPLEWSRFEADYGNSRYEVHETVLSLDGDRSYRDIPEWFWKCAAGGEDEGPWLAVTRQLPANASGSEGILPDGR